VFFTVARKYASSASTGAVTYPKSAVSESCASVVRWPDAPEGTATGREGR